MYWRFYSCYLLFWLDLAIKVTQIRYTMIESNIQKDIPSLISRDDSTAIKGLLLLLVAFGHTSMLTTNYSVGDKIFLWYWLYSFHVYLFFILPFVYGYKKREGTTKEINKKCDIVDIGAVKLDIKHNVLKIGVNIKTE